MDWEGIRTAILDRERVRLGLPTRAEEAARRQEMEIAAATSASQLESAELGREKTRAEIEALPVQQDLNRRATEALITDRLREPQPRNEPSSLVERIVAEQDPVKRQRLIDTHRLLNPEHTPRRRLPIRLTEWDPVAKRNVIRMLDPDTNEVIRESQAPMPAEQSKYTGVARSVEDSVKTMRDLAPKLSNDQMGGFGAPVVGLGEQVVSEITRTGPGADFDFAAQKAHDLVYTKTGAQLNETEQKQLASLVPRRDRANLPAQVARFEAYVAQLFAKYGVSDLEGSAQPGADLRNQGEGVTDPTAPPPSAAKKSKYKIVRVD